MSAAKNVSQAPNLLILYMTIRMLFFVAVVYVHVQNEVVIYHMMITCLITHTHLTMLKISYIIKGLSKAPLQMCQTSQIIFLPAFLFFHFVHRGGRNSSIIGVILSTVFSFSQLSSLRKFSAFFFSLFFILLPFFISRFSLNVLIVKSLNVPTPPKKSP